MKITLKISIPATALSGLEIAWQPLSQPPAAEHQPALSQVKKLLFLASPDAQEVM